MHKKAQGLSMNVIIIAAISLLVLVIISVLVLRAGARVNEGTGCQGTCEPGDCDGLGTGYIRDRTVSCPNEGDVCCIRITSGED